MFLSWTCWAEPLGSLVCLFYDAVMSVVSLSWGVFSFCMTRCVLLLSCRVIWFLLRGVWCCYLAACCGLCMTRYVVLVSCRVIWFLLRSMWFCYLVLRYVVRFTCYWLMQWLCTASSKGFFDQRVLYSSVYSVCQYSRYVYVCCSYVYTSVKWSAWTYLPKK
jgi:hypothetical protein